MIVGKREVDGSIPSVGTTFSATFGLFWNVLLMHR